MVQSVSCCSGVLELQHGVLRVLELLWRTFRVDRGAGVWIKENRGVIRIEGQECSTYRTLQTCAGVIAFGHLLTVGCDQIQT